MSYVALATTTLGSAQGNITFSSIPATYRDLVLVIDYQATANPLLDSFYVVLNGDTGNSYSYVRMVGDGSSASSFSTSGSNLTGNAIGVATTGRANLVTQFNDYSATDKHKTWLSRSNNLWAMAIAGRWANTAAINSISVRFQSTTFIAGSTFSLYGVAA
jgi:hypothetical protein